MDQSIFSDGQQLIDAIRAKNAEVEHFLMLAKARIGCLIGKQPKHIFAKIKTVSATSQALGVALDYIVMINEDHWPKLSAIQHEALIYHELRHAKAIVKEDGEIKYAIAKHDIEEFSDVVEKYGLCFEDVKTFAEVCKKK